MNLPQQLINGLVLGSGYACVALGWTLLLGSARLVNFAHGQLYMLGAFACWFAMTTLGLPYAPAILFTVVVVGALGLAMRHALSRMIQQQNLTGLMIATLGLGYCIQGGAALLFGGDPQNLHSPLTRARIEIGELWFTQQDVLVLLGTLALYATVWLVVHKTRLGATIRAVAEDPAMASLFGINRNAVYAVVLVFACASVALAATLVAPRAPILTSMGFDEVIMTFAIVVLGGIGSIVGTLAAAFGLGMFVTLFGAWVSPAYAIGAAFALMLAVLVLRPGGFANR